MKIISWNVNGFRSVYEKGFQKWLEKSGADIVCLQEIKAQQEEIETIYPRDNLFESSQYQLFINHAIKKGYSGVAVFSKVEPLSVKNKLGLERFDKEGRILELEYPNFTLMNLYIPHGGREKENMGYKLEVYDCLLQYFKDFRNKNLILAGDFNVAHTELDLARPQANQNNTMFTPPERQRLDKLIKSGFVDSFRNSHSENGHYTWWPYAVSARERNLGWRIDYVFISNNFASKLKNVFILPEVSGSDHCPIGVEIFD